MNRVFELSSAQRALRVKADERLLRWWPTLTPHIPGVPATLPVPISSTNAAADVSSLDEQAEARRVINAHLHRLHLAHDTVCAHATALTTPDGARAVLLLGGHGAGKTLVATALALRGWNPVAGDVALVHIGQDGTRLVGGTSAFVVRTAPTARWFPHFPHPRPTSATADLRHLWPPAPIGNGVPVATATWIRVDGDPHLSEAAAERLDAHTSTTVWWGASAHLVDRVSTTEPLRLVETEAQVRHRAALVDDASDRLPLTGLWGDPHMIAAAVEDITSSVSTVGQG
ncbi:hypothetical protein [Nocardiopsis nanhaiensis]